MIYGLVRLLITVFVLVNVTAPVLAAKLIKQ